MTTDPTNIPAYLHLTRTFPASRPPHLTAGTLGSEHIGRRVTIAGPRDEWIITGVLWRAEHEGARITDTALGDAEPTTVLGRRTVALDVGPFSLTVEATTIVTVLPEDRP